MYTIVSTYACINDTINYQSDTLITFALDLANYDDFSLSFDSYYDGQGTRASVIYSLDGGISYHLLSEIIPASEWQHTIIDLDEFSGITGQLIWLGFTASQWAVDNVEVSVLEYTTPYLLGYHVFLNDSLVTETTDTSWQFEGLKYGETYTASVGALYGCGLSKKLYESFLSGFQYPPRNLFAASYDNSIYLMWEPPLMPDTSSGDPCRDLWDTQFSFSCGDASGEAGVESDGNYIYTTKWNAGNGTFFRYELDGTFMGSFVIDVCMDVRDLAYDGELFWGSNAGTLVWGMDFDNETVEETINAPVAVRAIAYDQNFDAFWANNYDTDFTLFDKDGVILNSFAVGSYGTFYGLAWDDQEYDGTPCLYGHSQDNNATIVQFDIATGSETGVTYNSGAFGTQNAGGLAICDGIVPGYRTMLGILQNDVIFGLEFGEDNGSLSYIVPENLLGFNLYKNTEFLDYIEYVEEQNEFEYWDYDVEPGCHEYEVTALYDLYPYGMPEDTAETGSEGPAIICGGAAFPMPFYEDWESGSFENHEWSASSENWIVNHEIGNPGKSAEFKGLPELHNYEHELESFFIYTWDIVDGTMYFNFDIKLVDIEENASEKFIPGIYTNQEFHPMDTLYNSGTTEWLSKHYDVTDLFKDGHINNSHYFRLVFKVEGENSSNIDSWFIDNIYVYHLCEEPQNLSLEPQFGYEYSIAKLNWEPPFAPYHWLYYHDNTFENSLSSIEPGLGFAQLFIPEDHPATIQKAKLFIGDHLNYQNYIDVYLLSGDGNTILASPITVQAVEKNSWITINFGEVSIGEGHFLIYVQNLQENGPFLAVDDELENPNLYYGNPGNFTALNQWGYHFVSSCQAYITYNQTGNIVNNSNVLQPVSKNFRPKISLSNQQYMPEKAANQRALTGYNIWRNNELIQTNWPETYYNDTIYEAGEYSYFISAHYDQCESDTTGTVHISFFAAVNSYTESNQIIIYPNPVQEQLNIILNSQEDVIHHFTLTSASGQPVVSLSPDSRRIRLSISRLPEGLYIAEIRTGNKREFRKIIIN